MALVYIYTVVEQRQIPMGFDRHPTDHKASDQVEEWMMSALQPTRDRPTAVRFDGTTVVYWLEHGAWVAREFGRPQLLPISDELLKTIEADQEHAHRKMLERD